MQRKYHDELLAELAVYKPWDKEEEDAHMKIVEFIKSNEVIIGTSNEEGHVVASAWIVNLERTKVVMAHHRILDIWVQLGGHTDEGETTFIAALREGYEESGFKNIRNVDNNIFDLDVHFFPENRKRKAHYHYDLRYIFEADESDEIVVSNESKDVKWIAFSDIQKYTDETALIRMMEKARTNKTLPL